MFKYKLYIFHKLYIFIINCEFQQPKNKRSCESLKVNLKEVNVVLVREVWNIPLSKTQSVHQSIQLRRSQRNQSAQIVANPVGRSQQNQPAQIAENTIRRSQRKQSAQIVDNPVGRSQQNQPAQIASIPFSINHRQPESRAKVENDARLVK